MRVFNKTLATVGLGLFMSVAHISEAGAQKASARVARTVHPTLVKKSASAKSLVGPKKDVYNATRKMTASRNHTARRSSSYVQSEESSVAPRFVADAEPVQSSPSSSKLAFARKAAASFEESSSSSSSSRVRNNSRRRNSDAYYKEQARLLEERRQMIYQQMLDMQQNTTNSMYYQQLQNNYEQTQNKLDQIRRAEETKEAYQTSLRMRERANVDPARYSSSSY